MCCVSVPDVPTAIPTARPRATPKPVPAELGKVLLCLQLYGTENMLLLVHCMGLDAYTFEPYVGFQSRLFLNTFILRISSFYILSHNKMKSHPQIRYSQLFHVSPATQTTEHLIYLVQPTLWPHKIASAVRFCSTLTFTLNRIVWII